MSKVRTCSRAWLGRSGRVFSGPSLQLFVVHARPSSRILAHGFSRRVFPFTTSPSLPGVLRRPGSLPHTALPLAYGQSAAAVVLLLACLRVTAAQEACADQKDCEACVKFDGLFSGGCSWCKEAGTCFDEQTNGDSFCGTRCKGNDCFYKTCKLNNQTVLYVIVPIVCVVLIALIALLIWCCWCRPNAKLK